MNAKVDQIRLPVAEKYELRWNGGHGTAISGESAVAMGLAHDSGVGASVTAVRKSPRGGWTGRHVGWIVNGGLERG